jgi:protein-S-isoprenylcysteine O-methyltransferase Ste14
VNHTALENRFGKEKGTTLGKILGLISGWGFFIFLFGLWLSPQPHYRIPLLDVTLFTVPFLNIPIYLIHLFISVPLLLISGYLGIVGVIYTSLEVSETHRPKRVETEGIYSQLRHPQYLGAIFAHLAFSILFVGFYSLIATPLIIAYNYLISWKEEKELIREFSDEYLHYKEMVPMFVPKFIHPRY